MPTIKRALIVKTGMEKGTGRRYVIHRDVLWHCFRVLPERESRPWCHEMKQ